MIGGAYRDIGRMTAWLMGLLVALSLVEAANAAGMIHTGAFLEAVRTQSLSGDVMAAAGADDARQHVIASLNLVVLVVSLMTFLAWLYRAMSNVRALGAQGVYMPIWAVGSYFIPFLNLVAPYLSMSQIWRASSDAPGWQAQQGSPLVALWWAIWLAVAFAGFAVAFLARTADSLPSMISLSYVAAAYSLAEIVRNAVTIALLRAVCVRQRAQASAFPERTVPG